MTTDSTSYKYNSISNESLENLTHLAYSSKFSRRLCLHDDNDSNLHMMIIDLKPNAFYDFHSHTDSDEIAILLRGNIFYKFEDGKTVELKELDNRSIIIKQGALHSVLAGARGARFIEIIRGPFKQR